MRQTLPIAAAAAVSMIGLATPASATLEFYINVSGSVLTCSDNAACDTDPATGALRLAPVNVGGDLINGELLNASTGPDLFSNSVLSVINTTNHVQTVDIVLSDTDFVGPISQFQAAASSTWQNAIGAMKENSWFIDPANAQGAGLTGATPGVNVQNSFINVTLPVESFDSGPFVGPFDAVGPFSMTIQVQYNLPAFGILLNRGVDILATPVPEPSSWAMMGIGFAACGYLAFRRGKARMAVSGI